MIRGNCESIISNDGNDNNSFLEEEKEGQRVEAEYDSDNIDTMIEAGEDDVQRERVEDNQHLQQQEREMPTIETTESITTTTEGSPDTPDLLPL